MMVVMPFFCFFSATVFAKPAVAQIEEVRCLEHQGTDLRPWVSGLRSPTQDQRRDSGESVSLTGTVIRLPFRHIWT